MKKVVSKKLTDSRSERLHPKLRMISNGSDKVNFLRSELSSSVASLLEPAKVQLPRKVVAEFQKPSVVFAAGNESALAKGAAPRKPPKLAQAGKADHAFVNVLIEVERAGTRDSIGKDATNVTSLVNDLRVPLEKPKVKARIQTCVLSKRNFITATVRVSDLEKWRRDPRVAFIQPAEAITFRLPTPIKNSQRTGKPPSRKAGKDTGHRHGKNILIGIIDVGGFDFAHPDFLDAEGKTRFLSIWDQGGNFRKPPTKFGFGAEFTQTHLNAALAASRKSGGLPATTLERQSQQSAGSHGTHVASIAAGRSGVCSQAQIVGVLISVPQQGTDLEERRRTFSDSTRIIQAVEYLLDVAGDKPISINISLGTNGGPHDGSGGVSRWLDAVLATEGRSICVAAGNAGQEAGQGPNDIGWVMGRIHSSGHIQARGLDVELEWTVVGNSIIDVSENELEIWYGPQDRIIVEVKPPSSTKWITVKPREFIENKQLSSGAILSIYNELYHPTNGCNYAAVYLSPNLDPQNPRGVEAGVWKIRLHGEEIRDGHFHCWIERDDPYELDRLGQVRVFRFPSFFSERSNVDSHSVSSLACGNRVISVANLDAARQQINVTSSQGPTRDNRFKPDICAAGTEIVAANGFAPDSAHWISMTGTSMASPYVAGVIGLMLAVNSKLTAAQCLGILQRTAQPLPGMSYEWKNDSGFGQIAPEAAILEAKSFNERVQIK